MKRPIASAGESPARAAGVPATSPPAPDAVGAASAGLFDTRIVRRTVHGRAWTFRESFGEALEVVPAEVWANPGEHDCERVKQSATRVVWRARLDGGLYYLKYYADQGWSARLRRLLRGPTCEREWRNGVYAAKMGVAAVRPVAYTENVRCSDCTCSLLVTAAIEPAYKLSEYWRAIEADDDARRRRRDTADLAELLAEMIARAHQAGFEHRDMHAGNILVHPFAAGRYRTFLADLQSARPGVPLSDRAVMRNLAQLNQWFRRHSSLGDRLRFLRAYLRWRNEYEQAFVHGRALDLSFPQLARALAEAARRHAERLWAKRDRRAQRSNRYFSRIRVGGGWRGMVYLRCKRPDAESPASSLALDREWWRGQLSAPQRWFNLRQGQPCKQSHSALVTRAVLQMETERLPVIIKRPLARNWRRRLRQRLAPSRSMRGWRIGYALLNRDIPAARPLAVLEQRLGPLILDSVLLTEAVSGALDLEAHLRTEWGRGAPVEWRRHKRDLGRLLVRQLRLLAERGFEHRDCKAQNVLVVTRPRLKLLWVDMDGLRRVGRCSQTSELRALARLYVSLSDVPGLTRGDHLRFLKDYLARHGSDPKAWRFVWHELARRIAGKVRAKRRRRQWKLKHYGRA